MSAQWQIKFNKMIEAPDSLGASNYSLTNGRRTTRLEQRDRYQNAGSAFTVQQPTTVVVRCDLSPLISNFRSNLFDESCGTSDKSATNHRCQQQQGKAAAADTSQAVVDRRPHNDGSCYVNSVGRTPIDRQRLNLALTRVKDGGYYYGSITASEARHLLQDKPVGTFIVRDSSDRGRYPFSITVRISSTSSAGPTTSIRVVYDSGRFRFDGQPEAVDRLPTFDCVVDLIQYHIKQANVEKRKNSKSKMSAGCERTACSGVEMIAFIGQSARLADDKSKQPCLLPVVLRKPWPVSCSPSSLKHLSRRCISASLNGRSVNRLLLSQTLKRYLLDYPYDV